MAFSPISISTYTPNCNREEFQTNDFEKPQFHKFKVRSKKCKYLCPDMHRKSKFDSLLLRGPLSYRVFELLQLFESFEL